jgi:hypothetical protein
MQFGCIPYQLPQIVRVGSHTKSIKLHPDKRHQTCGKKKNPAILKSLKDKEKRGFNGAGGEGGILQTAALTQ